MSTINSEGDIEREKIGNGGHACVIFVVVELEKRQRRTLLTPVVMDCHWLKQKIDQRQRIPIGDFFLCGAEDGFRENSWWGVTEGLSCRGRGDGKSKMVSLFAVEEGGDEVGEEDTKDGKGVVEEIQGLVPKGRRDHANMGTWLWRRELWRTVNTYDMNL